MRYDTIIIGSGPAGLEAAINLKIRNKNILVLGQENLSDKLMKAPQINNYLGFSDITGLKLAEAFKKHISAMDIEILPEKATAIYSIGDYFSIATNKNNYEGTTIILAMGVHTSKPFVGEEEFLGRGVGYCATCDAPLYKNKKVVIVGYSEEAEHEANFVSELASEVIYISAKGTPTILDKKINVVNGKIDRLEGDKKAEKIVLGETEIIADGFFILRESIAPTSLVPGIKVEGAHVWVDSSMNTSVAGCFAAGDATGKPYQYIKAAGQGLVAAHSAVNYLDMIIKKMTNKY